MSSTNPFAPPADPSPPPRGIDPVRGATGAAAAAAVFSAAVAMAATLPGRTHGLGVLTVPLLKDFSDSLSEVDWAHLNLVATLVGSLFCFPCGWLVDRWGARPVGAASALVLGAVTLLASRATTPLELGVYVTLTRGVGQSMLSVVSLSIIGKAFPRRPGLAMGGYAVLMTLFMAVSMGILMAHTSSYGWRRAWGEVGWTVLAAAPLLWISTPRFRRKSAAEEQAAADSEAEAAATSSSASWPQALAEPCFWTFALAISFFGLVTSGVSLFLEALLKERNLGNDVFQTLQLLGLAVGLGANLVGGWLATKFRLEVLQGLALFILAGALAFLPRLQSTSDAYLYCVLYSSGGGMLTVLFFTVWGQAFGPRDLARIQGLAQMMTVLASAAGPALLAQQRALQGGPAGAATMFTAFAGVAAGLGLVSFLFRVPSAVDGAWAPPVAAPIHSADARRTAS